MNLIGSHFTLPQLPPIPYCSLRARFRFPYEHTPRTTSCYHTVVPSAVCSYTALPHRCCFMPFMVDCYLLLCRSPLNCTVFHCDALPYAGALPAPARLLPAATPFLRSDCCLLRTLTPYAVGTFITYYLAIYCACRSLPGALRLPHPRSTTVVPFYYRTTTCGTHYRATTPYDNTTERFKHYLTAHLHYRNAYCRPKYRWFTPLPPRFTGGVRVTVCSG